MNLVNNFDQIREMLSFESSTNFYFIQILKRRKENPTLKTNSKVVKDFYVYSLNEFDLIKDKIIDICNKENARAYIRLNKRCSKKTALYMMKSLTELIISENYKAAANLFPSVAGEFHSDPDKKWVLDIDDMSILTEDFIKTIEQLQIEAKHIPLMVNIPTKNGCHFITRTFNVQKFNNLFPNVGDIIKKDCPTLLYF
jgi:hypothetical protein